MLAGPVPADPVPADPVSADPVQRELEALLADVASAARDVTRRLRDRSSQLAPQPGRAEARDRATTTVECSLATMPHLLDHGVVLQRVGWPDPADRFPVVPITGLLELMAAAATALRPGAVVVGFADVRTRRWLVACPPTLVVLHAEGAGPRQVVVAVDGYATGTVLLAEWWPPPLAPAGQGRLAGAVPAPVTADRLYRERWMFHGPAFAAVSELSEVGDDGIRGVLTVTGSPGALLDGVGQLIGHWVQVRQTADRIVFPVAIDEVRRFGPEPPAGTRVACTARITELTATGLRADAVLTTGPGEVLATVTGWTKRRFSTNAATWALRTTPSTALLAQPQPDGSFIALEEWSDTATRELVVRAYLPAAERAEHDRQPTARQRPWLLARIAAKDAVRHDLRQRGLGALHPAEVTATDAGPGRLRLTAPSGEETTLTIEHSGPASAPQARARPLPDQLPDQFHDQLHDQLRQTQEDRHDFGDRRSPAAVRGGGHDAGRGHG